MNNTKKSWGSAVIALAIVVGILLSVFAVCAISYISQYNFGNRSDQGMIALSEERKNVYAQGTQKIQEIAQVPGMYTEDFGKLIKQDIEGRYGKDGSRATFQFLKEHDIKLDQAMYVKIQQTIEAFRNQFEMNQSRMIDAKRSYNVALGSFWQGTWLRIAGYPKIDLNSNDFKPITTDLTEQVVKDGKERGPLKLR